MSVFSKTDVDAVLSTLPEELRAPNSVVCSMYLEPTTKKIRSLKSHVFKGDHWGSYASEITDDDDCRVFNLGSGDCCGRAIGRKASELVFKTNPELDRFKEQAKALFREFHSDDGSASIAQFCLIPYDCETITFDLLPVSAQAEIKRIIEECDPYLQLHLDELDQDDDIWDHFSLTVRFPNAMAFHKLECGNSPIIIDFCISGWFGEMEADQYFLPEHQIFLPITDKLLLSIFSESQFLMRTFLEEMGPGNPPWLANALCQSVNGAFVHALERVKKNSPPKQPKDQTRKKQHHPPKSRYEVVTESPEQLAKARAEAKRVYEEMVAKHEERERKEAEERRQVELARREAIQKQRSERANAPEKPFSAKGPSHKAKDAPDVPEAPDARERAKRDSEKAAGIESAARHAAELKAAEEERVANEEAKLHVRRLGREIGGC